MFFFQICLKQDTHILLQEAWCSRPAPNSRLDIFRLMVGISPSRSHLLTLPSMHSSQIHHPVSCLGALAPPAQLLRTFYYFCLYLSRLYLFTEAMFKGDHLFQVPWYARSQLIRPSSSIPLSAGTLSMWGFHGKHLVTCPSVLPDYELHEAKVDVLFMKSQHLA